MLHNSHNSGLLARNSPKMAHNLLGKKCIIPETLHISTIYRLIIDPHNDQLLVGLISQLVEHLTGIAEVRV